MASYQSRQRDPLLDQRVQAMLERRGRELFGLALIAVSFAFALMLLSYSPSDPGWMVSSDEPVNNALGRLGAAMASTLMTVGGLGAWGIPAVLCAWGVRFAAHVGADRAVSRVVFAVLAVALGSIYAATLVPDADWPHAFGLGGLFGDTIALSLLTIIPGTTVFAVKVLSLISALAFVAMFLFVTGFSLRELARIGGFLGLGLIFGYHSLMQLLGKGAVGSVAAASTLGARMAERRAEAASRAEAERSERLAARQAAKAQAVGTARMTHAEEDDEATAYSRPEKLGAKPGALRAEPRAVAPVVDDEEPRSLLSRLPQIIRRAPEPEPELIEPPLSADLEAPSEDRIKARISSVIRARTAEPVALSDMSPISAAIAARREPGMTRPTAKPPLPRSPQPLVIKTAVAAAAGLVASRPAPVAEAPRRMAEPPLTKPRAEAGQMTAQPADWTAAPGAQPRSADWATDAEDSVSISQDTGTDDDYGMAAYESEDFGAPDMAAQDHAATGFAATGFTGHDLTAAEAGDLDAPIGADWPDEVSADWEPDYDPTPVAPVKRPPLVATRPAAPLVQAVTKKPAPSRQAIAEEQPRLRFEDQVSTYELPPLSLLTSASTVTRNQLSTEALEENARMLENVLDDYGVRGEITSVRPGPVVTMYELEPAPGLKASRVIGLSDDIARSMSALSARVSTVPGRTVIGIELPNATREKVVLREILSAREFGDSSLRLPLALGKDIGGEPVIANLAKMPHLLIAGTTGSGKSVAINTMILSLLYKLTPEECRLIMIDPKMLELSVYDGIPHLLSPVVTDPKKAVVALKWVVSEMEDRYRKMSKMGVRNIEGYNGRVREALSKGEMFKRTIQTGFDENTGEPVFETDEFAPVAIPYIVVVVDEMADLMMVAGKEIEACIQRLAQMARASGIHLIMATQRPSVDVITGTIKANFPTRISFQVTSKIDSRTILGEQGAEQLLGQGDMLYMAGGARITRIHGPFVSDEEVEEIVAHLKSYGPPQYMSGVVEGPEDAEAAEIDTLLGLGADGSDDSLYDQAVAIVARDRKCSTSYIQRKLAIGYQKAARLVEQMEENSVVTAANHVGKREILIEER
ncbi:DNA translocase FtsK 4TM domain-containing protein [Rhodobacter sp. KR11]|uniref:DNA translocase FtsK n=1 Tax=Rhodobacter sp. KR11 TaxID=2974588 RepID=UPI002222D31F|nr:DNA translocase FtsK 4TM domain-containing protein [Rhodobacter sp. KR11]MCW1920468.1 DNA translocase FtsK 4TM domain-containing protein [Rhodobacter sp. KR11]